MCVMVVAKDYFFKKVTLLNVFLTFCIVLLHAKPPERWGLPLDTTYGFIYWTHHLTLIGVPTFFFLSGLLFYRRCSFSTIERKLKARVHSLLVPYLLWNVVFVAAYYVLTHIPAICRCMNMGFSLNTLGEIAYAIINARCTDLWLVEVPPMSSLFTRIIIVESLFNTLGSPMITVLMATGNIRWYQIVVGTLLLFNIPIAYLLLKCGYPIVTPLVVSAIFILLGNAVRFLFCRKQLDLSGKQYGRDVLFPIVIVTILSLIWPLGIHVSMPEGWSRLLLTTLASCLTVSIFTYSIGLTASERTIIVSYIIPKVKKFIHIG